MTVAQLKAELSEKNLDLTGRKTELIARLVKHADSETAEQEEEEGM